MSNHNDFPGTSSARTPHWHHAHVAEPRWPVTVVVTIVIALQLTLPKGLNNSVPYLVCGLEALLLLAVNVLDPRRITAHDSWPRKASLALVGVMTAANMYSIYRLINELLSGGVTDARNLLMSGGSIWMTNVVVFGLLYWEFDRGGPGARSKAHKPAPDFLFPQMTDPDLATPGWSSSFFDYVYMSFTNSSAFSPTDVLPLTKWAKFLMMIQSGTSLVVVALVIARAVNILN